MDRSERKLNRRIQEREGGKLKERGAWISAPMLHTINKFWDIKSNSRGFLRVSQIKHYGKGYHRYISPCENHTDDLGGDCETQDAYGNSIWVQEGFKDLEKVEVKAMKRLLEEWGRSPFVLPMHVFKVNETFVFKQKWCSRAKARAEILGTDNNIGRSTVWFIPCLCPKCLLECTKRGY